MTLRRPRLRRTVRFNGGDRGNWEYDAALGHLREDHAIAHPRDRPRPYPQRGVCSHLRIVGAQMRRAAG